MLGALKCFSTIGAGIMLLVGLLFTAITVYAFVNQDVFITEETTKHQTLNGLIMVSSVVVVVAILGIIGVVRKICCLIFVYQVFVLVFFAVFVVLGSGAKFFPSYVFEGNCSVSSNALITSAYKIYNKSDEYFCKKDCPCAIYNSSLAQYSQQDQDILDKYYNISQTGVIATQKCQSFRNQTDLSFITPTTLGQLQRVFQCSDWCENPLQNNLFYRFSDVNNGKPKAFCYKKLKDSFYHYSELIATVCFVIAAILFVVCLTNICICCHPERKELSFRERYIFITEPQNHRGYKQFRE